MSPNWIIPPATRRVACFQCSSAVWCSSLSQWSWLRFSPDRKCYAVTRNTQLEHFGRYRSPMFLNHDPFKLEYSSTAEQAILPAGKHLWHVVLSRKRLFLLCPPHAGFAPIRKSAHLPETDGRCPDGHQPLFATSPPCCVSIVGPAPAIG